MILQSVYINVSSVTNAMRGKNLLERNGIRGDIHRAVDEQGNNGCGYRIRVRGDAQQAIDLLKAAGIRVLGVTDAAE